MLSSFSLSVPSGHRAAPFSCKHLLHLLPLYSPSTTPSSPVHAQSCNPLSPKVCWPNLAEPHKEGDPTGHTTILLPPLRLRQAPSPPLHPSPVAFRLQLHPYPKSRPPLCWGVRSLQQQLPREHAAARACWHPGGSQEAPTSISATSPTARTTLPPSILTSTSA